MHIIFEGAVNLLQFQWQAFFCLLLLPIFGSVPPWGALMCPQLPRSDMQRVRRDRSFWNTRQINT